MVTGAYDPEMSGGASLQCHALVTRLHDRVDFCVLTTTADRSLPADDERQGVTVRRIYVDAASPWSKAGATVRFVHEFLRLRRRFSIVHLHGFSQKSILLVLLALTWRKKIAIKLTSVGHDDPATMARRGGLTYWCYTRASAFFAVSPRFVDAYAAAGLPAARLRLIANGVDAQRFRPAATPDERRLLRAELGLPPTATIVLFVGFFSAQKRPHLLFDAWRRFEESTRAGSLLLFIGATQSPYYEIDPNLADGMRTAAADAGLLPQVRFVEHTDAIERFYRAADVFVLPSVREGLPNALLEAMATGLACISTDLEGVTSTLIAHGHNGLLVPVDDGAALEAALGRVTADPVSAARMGAEARRTIDAHYDLAQVSEQYFDAYQSLPQSCAG